MFKKWFKKKKAVTDQNLAEPSAVTDSVVSDHELHLFLHQSAVPATSPSIGGNLKQATRPAIEINLTGTPTMKMARDMLDLWHNSNYMGNINSMIQSMERGYQMNKLEQVFMDEMIEKYNATHKSALAKAMSEESNEE